MKYAWFKQHRNEFGISSMCWFMQVSRSAYYDWRHCAPTTREQEDAESASVIQEEVTRSRVPLVARRFDKS